MAQIGTSLVENGQKMRVHLMTNHTVTVPLYHIFIIPLKPVNYTFGINLQLNTLLEIEKNLFPSIK